MQKRGYILNMAPTSKLNKIQNLLYFQKHEQINKVLVHCYNTEMTISKPVKKGRLL